MALGNPRELITPDLFNKLTERVMKEEGHDLLFAERVIEQTLVFLVACAQNPGAKLAPSNITDRGWHAFILHTQAYAEFCKRVAGRFVHHLPAAVRDLVQEHTGRVSGSRPAGGDRSDITATLDTEAGRVFIKSAAGGIFARSLRNEAATNPHLASIAPRLLWSVEAEGWTVLGFEHIDGRHADYSPGSSDLLLLRDALESLQAVPLPDHVTVGVERHYGEIDVLTGDTLLHTDLHPDNVLIASGRAYLVDGAWASRGASWADLAMAAFRLMASGHTINSAGEWGRSCPGWEDGEPLDEFVAANARTWQRAADRDPQDWKANASRLATEWLEHRAG